MSVEQVVLYLFFGFFVAIVAGLAISSRSRGAEGGFVASDQAANALETRALGFGADDGAGRS